MVKKIAITHPLSEVFGFPSFCTSAAAKRYRKLRLCPFNNKVPNCTKDKADDPLGVCSIYHKNGFAITCPIRFSEDWIVAEHAANFFFPSDISWTSLTEVKLNDKNGVSAGNIDLVIVAYNSNGQVVDFGALEIQAVYITGNIRNPFKSYMENPEENGDFDWLKKPNYPHPDYLSSSRKRLLPQLLYKGGILNAWKKKISVALDEGFFNTLPTLQETDPADADIAWQIYDLAKGSKNDKRNLFLKKIVYTNFDDSLKQISTPHIGEMEPFIEKLQAKLDDKLENNGKPDTKTIDFGV